MRITKRSLLLVVPALAVLAAAYWWGSLRRQPQQDILLITIDTLRADHVGAYGHKIARTPNIDRLAETGLVFLQAITPMPRTTPGLASLLTGLEPIHHGSREVDQPIARGVLLPEILHRLGYQTIGVSANPAAGPKQGLGAGFDRFRVAEKPDSMRADSVTDTAIAFLDESLRAGPRFLWVHYNDPHAPYDPPKAWRAGQSDGTPCDSLVTLLTTPGWAPGHITADRNGVSRAALPSCVGLYDAEIAYVDFEIGRLLDALASRLNLANALIVLTADHGENLGEDGLFYDHGPSLHDASLRVPLIISAPGITPGRDEALAALQDVAPTALSLLDVSRDLRPFVDGQDLTGRLRERGTERAEKAERIVLAEGASSLHLHDFNWLQSGAAQTDHCINLAGFSLCEGQDHVSRLFDNRLDPTLVKDVSEQHAAVRRELFHAAKVWPPETARLLAARSSRFKLVARPKPEGGYRYAMYDLTLDPSETIDVAPRFRDMARRLREAMDPLTNREPSGVQDRSEVDVELLRSLGYLR